ncbi:MAG: hypothetical protein V1799_10380 [bacterium]
MINEAMRSEKRELPSVYRIGIKASTVMGGNSILRRGETGEDDTLHPILFVYSLYSFRILYALLASSGKALHPSIRRKEGYAVI